MEITLPDHNEVINGKVDYYLQDLAKDLRVYTDYMIDGLSNENDPSQMYKIALIVVMMSSEEKTVSDIVKATGQRKEFVKLGQEIMTEFIEVCRGIHMRIFLDIMEKYSSTTHMTLRLLNMEVSKFMHEEICPDYEDSI